VSEDVAEILVVCMGNICRSPFAEVLLGAEAEKRLGPEAPIWVHSAGVRGLGGHPATPEMQDEATERGVDLSRHRGAGITPAGVQDPDLVLAMTESQRDSIVRLAPVAHERVFTMKEFARLVEHIDLPDGLPPAERVRDVARRAHGVRARVAAGGHPDDVQDPYGGSSELYQRIAAEIDDLVSAISPALFGERS
jgi:protein-tyrosine phosphatase